MFFYYCQKVTLFHSHKVFLNSRMGFLVLTCIFSAILILLFKAFERNNVPVFQAIVFNYCTAAICGFIFLPDYHTVISGDFLNQGWFPVAMLLGVLFIVVFNLTSLTAINFGVSTASVASKLGLVFPVLLAFFRYNESFNGIKLAGILFAFIAVVLSSIKEKRTTGIAVTASMALLPFVVFIGNGACDSITQFVNKRFLMHQGVPEFTMSIFASAGTAGLIVLSFRLITGRETLNFKSVVGGIILGIPNYLSFLFLLKALASLNWGSSVIFPVNNLGTVAVATVVSFIVFKERISKINMAGLAFAAVAIVLIMLSS